jgi:lysophospholipase L1-like esterase
MIKNQEFKTYYQTLFPTNFYFNFYFMKNTFYKIILVATIILFFHISTLQAQSGKFQNEIDAFAHSDSIVAPLKGKIVFAGSSSFTKWKDVCQYFPGYPIVNRAFGGSTLEEVTEYVKETILQYEPKQVVIYCGENDLANNDQVSPNVVFARFTTLFHIIRNKLGTGTRITFISLKPSIARWNLQSKYIATNQLIATFLAQQKNAEFVDVQAAMLLPDGTVMKDIFIADNLHMNAKGYAIWQKILAGKLLSKL